MLTWSTRRSNPLGQKTLCPGNTALEKVKASLR
jgi:hypothetical protein